MPVHSEINFPFRMLSDEQLDQLIAFPVDWSNLLFELIREVLRRGGEAGSLILKYKNIRSRETEEVIKEFSSAFIMDSANDVEIARLRTSIISGRYFNALVAISEKLLNAEEILKLVPGGIVKNGLNKEFMSATCRTIVSFVSQSGRNLTSQEKKYFELAEFVATLGEVRATAAEKNITSEVSGGPRLTHSSPTEPTSWKQATLKLRHSSLHPDAESIHKLKDASYWADLSPLKMVEYSVNIKDGLPEKERRELLQDFCDFVELPINLPNDYKIPWGSPGSAKRIYRVAKHLGFLIKNFERQTDLRFTRAIECWKQDFDFLMARYRTVLDGSTWLKASKGL